jgi:hypothetical protein
MIFAPMTIIIQHLFVYLSLIEEIETEHLNEEEF